MHGERVTTEFLITKDLEPGVYDVRRIRMEDARGTS